MMTTQEAQALREFLAQLTQVRGAAKDPEAASMIGAAFAQQPDAGYLLVQRSMLQDQALASARTQIEQLQAQVQAQSQRESARGMNAGSGFLDPANAWGNTPSPGARAPVAQPRFGTAPAPQYVAQAAPQYAPAPAPASGGLFGGGGGFLGSMAATAAGVAGGAFLFQGIESLMGHHGGGAGFMGQNNGLPTENTTINNFYGSENDAPVASSDSGVDTLSAADDSGGNDDLGSSDDMSSI